MDRTDALVKTLFPEAFKRGKNSHMEKKEKKIKKSVKPSIKSHELPKNAAGWDQYLSTISWQMCPANDAFYDRLAIELVTWAREKDDAIFVEDFFDIKGIYDKDLIRFMEKNENLRKAYEMALSVIGRRRERRGLTREFAEGLVKFTMPLYDKKWAAREKEVAALRDPESKKPTEVKVVMHNYGSDVDIKAPELTDGDE